ncbi:uncharacterized protein K489DRAFT_384134 [Dissoconium aciculare CBS 342.82]|uniref:Histidine-specific methyltransferase SAM-dependent domain-containing protein n=1 Tax=Dissoconium aciculare CBS 342.82 TaxID=1314786 RepID=A0A6J3LTV6_9PEZI|nr:uncharacterized protein K489DRAFT_384134 [Dissoconium aciculare CBS 342.82]KAF1819220.1 hypothetical protein K489DRAFT_384134 [Dissoconium aciculare CBS 342.82]
MDSERNSIVEVIFTLRTANVSLAIRACISTTMLQVTDETETKKGSCDLTESLVASYLGRNPRSLPSTLLWDDVELDIYEQITQSPDYYLTRAESEIIRDEFLDDWVNDDWPDEFYVAYRQRLSEKGVRLPPTSNLPTGADDSVPSAWQISYWLEKIIENAAPWWLPGDLETPAAAEALQTSAAVVREGLEILNQRATAATPGR